ncbi:amidohydrolase [Arcicella rosea]|uniref:Omega-amidase YafV n=1 Tax=Arcicella rosea TaxID=502909 RepID=A0A841EVC5_9BACT|nr:amidohydrolase [Arcicella rosea]MBB6005359.1 putative amidohydrolase [Arcicella rosea]
MQDLSITLIQTDLYWENSTANLAMLEEKIAMIATPTDLIVLPEMFNSGFTMNVEQVGEPMNFFVQKWMKQQAAQTNAVVTGSFIAKEGEKYFNRLIWMRPDGSFEQYDKRHLFRMGGEHHYFTGGTQQLIVELKGWKICPLICYDLRFPVWSRNVNHAYDLLIYVANWPAVRSKVWDTLLQARAIENQSYVIGVNRVGKDGMDLVYSGNSTIIDFKGNHLFYQPDSEIIKTQVLNKKSLAEFREQVPAYLDADSFEINNLL